LHHRQIANAIRDIFDNVDGKWAVNNVESTGASVSLSKDAFLLRRANTDIGFPMDLVIQNNIGNWHVCLMVCS